MNPNYKKLRALLAVLTDGEAGLDDMIFEAMERAGTPVSRSRLQGWRVSEGHKNYRRMSGEDFGDVLHALILYFETQQSTEREAI